MTNFPYLSESFMRRRLALPPHSPRVVIDTDTANEIDDQFALAWALRSQDRLHIEGVYAEPFSFRHRLGEMKRARIARDTPELATPLDHEMLEGYAGMLAHYEARGYDLDTVDLPPFNPPGVGMERSYAEILRVFELMNEPVNGRVLRGVPGYLEAEDKPVRCDAVEDLIERALASPDDDPLYVAAIGCLTNIGSALLLAPEIIRKIVVIWTAGYPSTVARTNFSLNMEQDMVASKVLFESGVPLVYQPGFHVGAQLRLSLPEMEAFVKGRGAIGDYLYHLYTHNPLWEMLGITGTYASTWVIWDLITIAWLLNPRWVPSELVPAPKLGDDRRWYHNAKRHLMREAYDIQRDAIFADFFRKLENA